MSNLYEADRIASWIAHSIEQPGLEVGTVHREAGAFGWTVDIVCRGRTFHVTVEED